MEGISPALPLAESETDGLFKLNKTTKQVARQNLKMLILTSPGERVMNPAFGCGARNFLFENPGDADSLREEIIEQARVYIPFIRITAVEVVNPGDGQGENPNTMQLFIDYEILGANEAETFAITL
tara:strand:- start:816 stop:1193 length:378 start_codon:yes stop_codon:yes gene_type:complete